MDTNERVRFYRRERSPSDGIRISWEDGHPSLAHLKYTHIDFAPDNGRYADAAAEALEALGFVGIQ